MHIFLKIGRHIAQIVANTDYLPDQWPPHYFPASHQACPSGFRVNRSTSECVQCEDGAVLRDYLFLGFVCLVCVAVRLAIVRATNVHKPPNLAKL